MFLDKDTVISVHLQGKSFLLNEVQVVAKKPVYEFQNEKLIVNVGEIPNVQTYNLSKLLNKLPGVVNSDDALTLNGQSATIYLDNRKQVINSSNTNSILQSIPVAAIEKIELIYSSNGVYDAADGAIINIVYKKQRVDGYYLSVGGIGAAYNNLHLDGGSSATFMFKKKNVMLNSMLSYRNNYVNTQANDTLQYWNNASLYQDRNSESRTNVYMGMLNLNWDVKEGHKLNFNFNFYDDFSNSNSKQQSILQNDNTPDIWNVTSKGNDDLWAGQIEYTSPDTLRNILKASYGIIYGGLRSHRSTLEKDMEILYTNDEMVAHRHTIKFDYEHKFSPMNLLLGLKTDLGQLNDDIIYTKTTDYNHYPTNHFLGKENIYAGYAQLKYKFNKIWSASTSLRSEHTSYTLDFLTLNEKIADEYTNLFPYFTVSYNSNNRNIQSSVTYGSSITRPDYNFMLSGIRYSTQYNYVQGNPELKPNIDYTLQWRSLFYQFINIYLAHQQGTNLVGIVAKNSSIDPLITEHRYQNIADYNAVYGGGDISYQLLSDKLSGSVGGQIQYLNYENPKNGFELPQGKTGFWRGNLNVICNYQITEQLGINYEYYFFPKYNNFVSTNHSRWLMNAGVHYKSRKDKWSLSIDVNNIFNSNRQFKERYFGDNFSKEHSYHRTNQFVQISFRMKFKGGEKVEDKAKYGSVEMDRFSTK